MVNIRKMVVLSILLLVTSFFSGCTKRQRTLAGVVLGAGIGILVGAVTGNTGGAVAGALIGGTTGGVVGNVSGNSSDGCELDSSDRDYWEH